MNIHFIAIGGSAMHNLAIALKQKGYSVTGSDDEIFEPSKSCLEKEGLLPVEMGWYPQKITGNLDAVILGMHARVDNPELLQAQKLGIKIFSYPEYLYEQTKAKIRVVIGGSHGKTTITSMIMHVLKGFGVQFDYMVGAHVEGFENMVGLSEEAKVAVFEGDEYLASPIDPRPKFHIYKPHIALISGIAWDHINVFPTFKSYRRQFELFIETIDPNGYLVFCIDDPEVRVICKTMDSQIKTIPYTMHPFKIKFDRTYLLTPSGEVEVRVFGHHNMQNISAAKRVCNLLGVSDDDFYGCISSFRGAAKRMQRIGRTHTTDVFLDFAHAPSKVVASVKALKDQYPYRKLVACLELHTFSSLNPDFLNEYKGTLDEADFPIVFYNPATLKHKKLPFLEVNLIKQKFGNPNLVIFDNPKLLYDHLYESFWDNTNLILMSSGNFSGLDILKLASEITEDDNFPGCYMDF